MQTGCFCCHQGCALEPLLAAFFPVQHIGASDFVVTPAHQAEFGVVLDVFNVESAAARPRAHQGPHDGLGQAVHRFTHTG